MTTYHFPDTPATPAAVWRVYPPIPVPALAPLAPVRTASAPSCRASGRTIRVAALAPPLPSRLRRATPSRRPRPALPIRAF